MAFKRARAMLRSAGMLCVVAQAACLSVPRVEMEKAGSSSIKTIALLRVSEPKLTVMNMGGAAGAFGAAGGLVQGSVNAGNTQAYAGMVSERNITFAPLLKKAVSDAVTGGGYELISLDGAVPLTSDRKHIDFGAVRTDADAIMYVWYTRVGWVSPAFSADYIPWVDVRVRLVDSKSKRDLYYKMFTGGFAAKIEGAVNVPSDPKYRYGSFDALRTSFPDSVRGIEDTVAAIAAQIGKDLARAP